MDPTPTPSPTTALTETIDSMLDILPIVFGVIVLFAFLTTLFQVINKVLQDHSSSSDYKAATRKPAKKRVYKVHNSEPTTVIVHATKAKEAEQALTEAIRQTRKGISIVETLETRAKEFAQPKPKTTSNSPIETYDIPSMYPNPKASVKKPRLADEPEIKKESFFDKLLGRIPKED